MGGETEGRDTVHEGRGGEDRGLEAGLGREVGWGEGERDWSWKGRQLVVLRGGGDRGWEHRS